MQYSSSVKFCIVVLEATRSRNSKFLKLLHEAGGDSTLKVITNAIYKVFELHMTSYTMIQTEACEGCEESCHGGFMADREPVIILYWDCSRVLDVCVFAVRLVRYTQLI